MELIAIVGLIVGGIALFAFLRKPEGKLVAPTQEVDTTVPSKGVPAEELSLLKENTLKKMTKAQIAAELDKCGVTYDRKKTKASLIEKYLGQAKH